MARVVALLRGINVGGHKRVAMADLRKLVEEAGYGEVRTHLNSGNVVLSADEGPDDVARAIEEGIAERLDLDVDVIVRTAEELAGVVDANPLGDVATDGSKHLVMFLSAKPDPAILRELGDEDFAPDRFGAHGCELYVWCPNGMRDSRLMKTISGKRLAPVATVRNWNTVTKLLEMVR
jgi:uncharacterized protein (DUF1697 family)